jgi:hypothetical protein
MKIVVENLPLCYRAVALGPVVFVAIQWAGSNETLVHEEAHVRQWYLVTALFLLVLAALFWPAVPLAAFAYSAIYRCSRRARSFFEADAVAAEVRHGTSLRNAATNFLFCYDSGWSVRRARSVIRDLSRG